MQLRMLARRSLGGSMTVVGDIAQATGSWAPATWAEVVAHLPAERGWRQVELTVNYRTPNEIMVLAGRVLEAAAPGMVAPEAVRDTGEPVRFVSAAAPGRDYPDPAGDQAIVDDQALLGDGGMQQSLVGEPPAEPAAEAAAPSNGNPVPSGPAAASMPVLATAAAHTASEELAALAGGAGGDGRLAIIAPPSLLEDLATALRGAGIEAGSGHDAALDARATLLAVEEAKGLEFDAVVVVDPARIAEEAAQGLRSVYVALTRTTRRLAIVHEGVLPESMQPVATAGTGGGASSAPG